MQCGQILASSLLSMEAIVTATAISGMSSIEREESCGMERISPSLRATPQYMLP